MAVRERVPVMTELKNKRKIVLLSDHPLSTSGVGTQARWLVSGLVDTGRYAFRCLGGALKHQSMEQVAVNPDFVIKPVEGFGGRDLLRQILAVERPDALMLFTDPRFFVWVWEMEDEVHQVCPIVYNHLWDNLPAPEFNKVLYESTDAINCINWPTYEMLRGWFPERTRYVPHAVPEQVYHPLPEPEAARARAALLGAGRADHFVALWVGRNARRKMPSDILTSWRMFLDRLQAEKGHQNATLIMHTDPLDPEGANLHHVLGLTGLRGKVFFSNERAEWSDMCALYNAADVVLNRSCAEGFGLPILEGLMCGRPAIAIKTGGLTRQIVNHETGEQHGVALDPDVSPLVGNQMVPYIREDYVSDQKYADALWRMHETHKEERRALGLRAREYALREYSMKRLIGDWDDTLTKTIDAWKASPPRRWRQVAL